MSDLFTFRGETDGTSTTGAFPLYTPEMEKGTTVTHIEIDKGMVAKIWEIEVDGAIVDVIIRSSPDDGTTWQELKRINHTVAGHEEPLRLRRPIIVEAKNDKTRIDVRWSQTTAAKSYVSVTIEFDIIRRQRD